MRPRDFGRIASTPADLLVCGGGLYGLTIAREAARRGLRTTLVDASDFGSGRSGDHQPIVPGALPALWQLRVARARAAVRERRALAQMAPWLLRPLPVLVSTHRSAIRGRLALRAAFALDAWVGRHRNAGVEPELHLPAARLISRAATLRLFPGVRQDGLTGGAQWYDYQILDQDRLTVAFAAAAQLAGAELAPYVGVTDALRENGRVTGLRVRDALGGEEAELRATVVVNAAGADAAALMAAFGVNRAAAQVEALTLVTSKHASDIALAAPARDGRLVTLLPWHGRAAIAAIGASSVEALVADANHAFPALALREADVTLVHRGSVPAGSAAWIGDNVAAPEVIDHASDGAPGAITVLGTHLTGARRAARRVLAKASALIGRRVEIRRDVPSALPGAGIADHEALAIETARAVGLDLPLPLIRHLIARYAEHAADIVRLMAGDQRLRRPLHPARPHVAAEVIYAIREEMALTLADIVIRRMGVGALDHPGPDVLQSAAALAAPELAWDDARTRREVAAVDACYRVGGGAPARGGRATAT